MLRRTTPQAVGNLARTFAAVPFLRRSKPEPPTPILLPGYLETADACARANECLWCLRALAARAQPATCPECGREAFRRRCRDCGPCAR